MNKRHTHGTTIQLNSTTSGDLKLMAEFRKSISGVRLYKEHDHGERMYFTFDTEGEFDQALKHVPLCQFCERMFSNVGNGGGAMMKCPHCAATNYF